jgi:hypothetical protein
MQVRGAITRLGFHEFAKDAVIRTFAKIQTYPQ